MSFNSSSYRASSRPVDESSSPAADEGERAAGQQNTGEQTHARTHARTDMRIRGAHLRTLTGAVHFLAAAAAAPKERCRRLAQSLWRLCQRCFGCCYCNEAVNLLKHYRRLGERSAGISRCNAAAAAAAASAAHVAHHTYARIMCCCVVQLPPPPSSSSSSVACIINGISYM